MREPGHILFQNQTLDFKEMTKIAGKNMRKYPLTFSAFLYVIIYALLSQTTKWTELKCLE